ncbi:outer membrane lipoprotein carrier protein LolA [Streptomyces longwoodensis]|uniref:LolA family protein n=1 Tax=Streptomyces longwoodensis TaxID=68231 RepID=UPI0036FEECCC
MAPYASDDTTSGRRKAVRYVVPVTVVGVAAATIGLVPALADSGDPDLPKITAQQLIEKIAASDVEQLSGTVKITTDLGLPDLGGLAGSLASAGGGAGGAGDGSSADPSARLTELASGTHTLRIAADGPDRQKVSLLEKAAEYSVIHNGTDVWGYDSATEEVYHSKSPEGADAHGKESGRTGAEQAPTPKEFADQALKAVDGTTSVTVDGTVHVAGRDAYKLLVKPKDADSTVGAISIAVDAKTGLPLKFTLTPKSGGAAVVDAGFTQVRFAKPAASTFDFTPPKGAKVTEADDAGHSAADRAKGKGGAGLPGGEEFGGLDGLNVLGDGWDSIATFDTGSGSGLPSASKSSGGEAGAFGDLLGSFGDKATGKFGSGTVFSTRLVNALITDDGKVFAGAVTKDALVKAADAAKK